MQYFHTKVFQSIIGDFSQFQIDSGWNQTYGWNDSDWKPLMKGVQYLKK